MESLPKIYLLFGFLGAGKTTLVRNLLQNADSSIPTAVIVNEFGDVGIDGQIIQGNTIDTVELVSGCICCTLKGSLMSAIEELVDDKGARRIVVEATGVADPEDMLDDLEDTSVTDSLEVAPLVTVVDASGFNKIRPVLGEFYTSQILNSDLIIVNKIDRTNEAELENVSRQIKEINPWAEVRFTEHCDVDANLIFSDQTSTLLQNHEASANGHDHHHDHDHGHHHGRHDTMESCVIAPSKSITQTKLEEYFNRLPETVWRMKGHMLIDGQPHLVQYAAGQLNFDETEPKTHYRMVAIGQELDEAALANGLGVPITSAEQ